MTTQRTRDDIERDLNDRTEAVRNAELSGAPHKARQYRGEIDRLLDEWTALATAGR